MAKTLDEILRDLRQARHLTQEHLAEILGVEQENVSRIERRADLLLLTLANYVAAMGGKLRLIAEFPDRKPVVVALSDLSESAPEKPRGAAVTLRRSPQRHSMSESWLARAKLHAWRHMCERVSTGIGRH